MTQGWAEVIVFLAGVYVATGFVLGVAFVVRGIERVDAAAVGSGWAFRLLILPGATVLWPIVLRRWLSAGSGGPVETNAHRRAGR